MTGDDRAGRRRWCARRRSRADPEAQTLEDVICLVFLENYFAEFAGGARRGEGDQHFTPDVEEDVGAGTGDGEGAGDPGGGGGVGEAGGGGLRRKICQPPTGTDTRSANERESRREPNPDSQPAALNKVPRCYPAAAAFSTTRRIDWSRCASFRGLTR